MDAFEEPFWNLDQLRAWALTRDPDLVRVAALPRVDGQQINSGLNNFKSSPGFAGVAVKV